MKSGSWRLERFLAWEASSGRAAEPAATYWWDGGCSWSRSRNADAGRRKARARGAIGPEETRATYWRVGRAERRGSRSPFRASYRVPSLPPLSLSPPALAQRCRLYVCPAGDHMWYRCRYHALSTWHRCSTANGTLLFFSFGLLHDPMTRFFGSSQHCTKCWSLGLVGSVTCLRDPQQVGIQSRF
jgi:hypothetical protein